METLEQFMTTIGLNEGQIQNRKTYLGGSSAKDIVDGNWGKIYDRIVGGEREDLSKIFKVQLGHITEHFNLLWFADMMDMTASDPAIDPWRNLDHPYIGCLPDSIMTDARGNDCVVDAKHTGAEAPWWDDEKVATYYFPQAQHNMIATGIHDFYLSVIFGNDGPRALHIKYDEDWCEEYKGLCKNLWGMIEKKIHPGDGLPKKLTIPEISFDDMRTLDMTEGNQAVEWGNNAHIWLNDKEAFDRFESCKKEIKEMIPDDVKRAYGDSIEAVRNRRGSITIRKIK
jgi:hypothetical protein